MNHTPVTTADIEAAIAFEHYFTAYEGVAGPYGYTGADSDQLTMLTFCVLVTHNGHAITGEFHCQDPAKFSEAIGRTEARKDAINKLWPMAVYAARQMAS